MISEILEAVRSLGPEETKPFPCVSVPELFFAPEGEIARERKIREGKARERCAVCPVSTACAQMGRDLQEFGIWGGENEKQRAQGGALPTLKAQRAWKRAVCGTEGGYQHHRKKKEEICARCAEAHRIQRAEERARERKKSGKPKRVPKGCGTYAAARRHERKKEVLCDACLEAMNAYKAGRKAKRAAQAGKVAA